MLTRFCILSLSFFACSSLWAVVPNAAETAAQHYHTGLAYERLGRLDEAYTELQLACALDAANARMALALGVVAVRLGHLDVAQRSLENSITIDANSIASYYQLAYLYETLGSKDRAIDSWHRFFELNQDPTLKQEARKHLQVLEVFKDAACRVGVMKGFWVLVLLTACSSPTVIKPPEAKISKVRHIAVQKFEGAGGAEVTQAMLKSLAGSGLVIVDAKKGADAMLTGSVSEYRTGRKVMIVLGNTHSVTSDGQKIDVSNPVVSLSGSPLQNPSLGNPQMVGERAAVRVLAKLVDVPNGNVMWVGEASYESLALPSALQTVTTILVQALQEAAPRLQHRSTAPSPS